MTLLSALSELDVENLQKIGTDLANLISTVIQVKSKGAHLIAGGCINVILDKVGAHDNDLVLLCLSNKKSLLMEQPRLI